MNRNPAPRLDPRLPLVIDTHELGRRAGSMRETQISVPAPEGLGLVDLIAVPAGAELDLDLRLESVMDGVLVTVALVVPVTGECGRCLDDLSGTLRIRFQELYAYPGSELLEDEDDTEGVSEMSGDLLDLEPALRDAVVLALPLNPLCRQDCEGLCVDCGERLADLPDDHQHDVIDPRWTALAGLQGTEKDKREN